MSNNSDINQDGIGKIDIERQQLTLPFTQDQFQEFISNLFGKPEKLQRIIKGNFEIELGDIKDLYLRIEERIYQQNKGLLVQFTSKIFYDDNSSILLNGIESLSNYSEPRSVIPIKIELNWQYLIKFQDRNVPEKQEIELFITTQDLMLYSEKLNLPNIYTQSVYPVKASGFAMDIKYTARTWATDIDSMLTEHIENLMLLSPARGQLSQLISESGIAIFSITFIGLYLISIIGGYISSNKFISSMTESSNSSLLDSDLSAKVDFLVSYISTGEVARFYFFLAVFLLVMLVISVIAGIIAASMTILDVDESYIILTKKARNKREKDLIIERNQPLKILASIILGIVVNIVSAYLFLYLTTKTI